MNPTWETLKCITCWTPVSGLEVVPENIGDGLFRVAPSAYLFTVEHDDQDDPAVTLLLWAGSDGAAQRAMNARIEEDSGEIHPPPQELLLPNVAPEYGALVESAKRLYPASCAATASYRIASDGAFIHHSIHAGPFEFLFRNPDAPTTEQPYAVIWRLPQTAA